MKSLTCFVLFDICCAVLFNNCQSPTLDSSEGGVNVSISLGSALGDSTKPAKNGDVVIVHLNIKGVPKLEEKVEVFQLFVDFKGAINGQKPQTQGTVSEGFKVDFKGNYNDYFVNMDGQGITLEKDGLLLRLPFKVNFLVGDKNKPAEVFLSALIMNRLKGNEFLANITNHSVKIFIDPNS